MGIKCMKLLLLFAIESMLMHLCRDEGPSMPTIYSPLYSSEQQLRPHTAGVCLLKHPVFLGSSVADLLFEPDIANSHSFLVFAHDTTRLLVHYYTFHTHSKLSVDLVITCKSSSFVFFKTTRLNVFSKV